MSFDGDHDSRGEETTRATAAAQRLLAVRPRSTEEVRRRLSRNYAAEVVDRVVEQLLAEGLLDDRAFAEQWVAERHWLKRLGPIRLSRELRDLGVSKELVEHTVSSLSDEEQDKAVRELIDKWESQARGSRGARAKQALYEYVVRRGHRPELVRLVIGERYP